MFSWKLYQLKLFNFKFLFCAAFFEALGSRWAAQWWDINTISATITAFRETLPTDNGCSFTIIIKEMVVNWFFHIFLSSSSFSRQGNRSSIAFNGNSWVPYTPPSSINIFKNFLTDIFESLLLNIDKKTFISILISLLIFTAGSSIVFNGNSWVPSPSLQQPQAIVLHRPFINAQLHTPYCTLHAAHSTLHTANSTQNCTIQFNVVG